MVSDGEINQPVRLKLETDLSLSLSLSFSTDYFYNNSTHNLRVHSIVLFI